MIIGTGRCRTSVAPQETGIKSALESDSVDTDEDINRSESLALGSAAITPLEMARGMSTFANGGHLIEPYFISEITDAYGNSLGKAQPLIACDEELPKLLLHLWSSIVFSRWIHIPTNNSVNFHIEMAMLDMKE